MAITELNRATVAAGLNRVLYDGTQYVYGANNVTLYALLKSGSTVSLITSISMGSSTGNVCGLWYDGTYIYTMTHPYVDFSDYLIDVPYLRPAPYNVYYRAYTFNGATFTQVANLTYNALTPPEGFGITGDGTYIYSLIRDDGVNPCALYAHSPGLASQIAALPLASSDYSLAPLYHGGFIYFSGADGIHKYSFDGISFSLSAFTAFTFLDKSYIATDGTRLFVTRISGTPSVEVFDLNLTWQASIPLGLNNPYQIAYKNGFLFVPDSDKIRVYDSSLSLVDSVTPFPYPIAVAV